uniref:Cadherin-12 n=1 Tax=Cyprinus carpio TaxID=7962 RepID=A0A8C2KPC9_CYPCA
MDNCSALHVLLMISIMPGWLGGDFIISKKQHEIRSSEISRRSHLRVRRGWIWSQIFVEEEDPTPRKIGQLKSDYDTGDFTIKYILSGEGASEIFKIDEYTGDIYLSQRLDRELKPFYILQAQAINRSSKQPVEPESEFIIKVQDINDNAPEFINEPYVSSIPEMCPTGTTVIQVTATDADDPMFGNNAKLIYSILEGEPYFSVEPKTGIIVTSWPNMDREARETYLVVVQVKDMLGLTGGYSATTTVTISLMDVNDNGPTFQHNLYTFAISESAPVGTTLGRIMADDGDVGLNAKMNYSLEDLEESSTFTIQTDPDTQEGIVILAQPLDYETKRRFVIAVEAINENIDTRFMSAYEFRDRTTIKITVTNVDEPPIFYETPYNWKVLESAQIGTQVGTVYAKDTDTTNNAIRYSILKSSDTRQMFKIDPSNGTVYVANLLDRETAAWYNLTINARENSDEQLSSSVSLRITLLDINDNVPTLSQDYQPYVCEDTQAGELIELISATDADDPVDGHHFYFSMIPDKHINPNFTIRDNQVLSTLMLAVRKYKTLRQEKMATQELETVEFSEKILSFAIPNTESTQTVPLRHPRRRERKLCREEVTTSIRMSLRHSHLIGPEDTVFQQFIMDRLAEADEDPYVPPFDCMHTYTFEGTGSVTGSLSSLESAIFDPCMIQTHDAGPHLLPLSPWLGAAADETSF